jgi:hypothetical protein
VSRVKAALRPFRLSTSSSTLNTSACTFIIGGAVPCGLVSPKF